MDKIELKQFIERIVREEYQMLIEYSFNRKDFINKVENLLSPLLSHWVLIRYHRLINNNDYINHWKQELTAWFESIMRLKLKNGDKAKTIETAFNNLELKNDLDVLYLTVIPKCRKENINVQDVNFNQAIVDCQNAINDITNILSSNKPQLLYDYINNL